MPFTFNKQSIPEVIEIIPKKFEDQRGWFAEVFKMADFKELGITQPFIQANHSKSAQSVVRALHYQKDPHAQAKLVSVVSGKIFDVAVDIRKDSPAYGKWVGKILDAEQKNMLYVPRGFAHGFSVLSETAEVIYYCDSEYNVGAEGGIAYNDPELNIDWQVENPNLSEKDIALPFLEGADNNFTF